MELSAKFTLPSWVPSISIGERTAYPVIAMIPDKRYEVFESLRAIGGLETFQIAHGAQAGGVVAGPLLEFFGERHADLHGRLIRFVGKDADHFLGREIVPEDDVMVVFNERVVLVDENLSPKFAFQARIVSRDTEIFRALETFLLN